MKRARFDLTSITRIAAGAVRRARRMIPHGPRPAILMYHRVAVDSFDPWGLAVDPICFEDQLRWLSENRTILSLDELAARHRSGTLPADAIALTFDDGYACVAEVAAPLLRSADAPATVFIAPSTIQEIPLFWWDELRSIVLCTGQDSLVLDGSRVSLGKKSPSDERWKPGDRPRTERQIAFRKIWAALREKAPAALERAMCDLRMQSSAPNQPGYAGPMGAEQVREAASEKIRFGSHTLTHSLLTSLDPGEKVREISESAEACAKLSGQYPAEFAYPFGILDSESKRLVREAGFACACTTAGTSVSPKSDVFALPRIHVRNWNGPRLGYELARR